MTLETLSVEFDAGICRVRFDRAEAGNTINAKMIEEMSAVLRRCEEQTSPPITILVLEGAPDVFCAGGDFEATASSTEPDDPEPLYDLWLRLTTAPLITISVVKGRANAGGVGFVAASDIVLADEGATFGLSELLFGLFPACVLPFLIRRIGFQKAHYLTLMTRPISAAEALSCGLVDALESPVESVLRQHLLRLRHLDKTAIGRYKKYMSETADILHQRKAPALDANRALFSDPKVRANISRYVTEMKLPWET
jgi:polyketide biosynthesis enoyl-CoA hydratase PksH